MKERPILFQGPMVRALLDGTKTQTRRALRIQPFDVLPMNDDQAGLAWVGLTQRDPKPAGTVFRCKFGVPGDRLWVRESFYQSDPIPSTEIVCGETVPCEKTTVSYAADQYEIAPGRLRPSIHMPRWASRILLEIVSVRVERLAACGDNDAKAEGVTIEDRHMNGYCAGEYLPPSVRAYRDLWESINGAGSWAANPWVWVVEFKRVTA